ncbi:hypothetical protein LINGRAHAP2_LOCUS27122 [Linum grandiflorum]
MEPMRKNQKCDLPQPFVEEEQMAASDAGYGGSSSNIVREEVPPQSAPSADLGGAVTSLLQMMEGSRKLMEENRQVMVESHQSLEGRLDRLDQNHKRVILQLKSLDELYESYNFRVDRCLSQVIDVVNQNKSDFDEFRNFLTSSVAQTRNRSLDDVKPIIHNFNGNINMSISLASGRSSHPRHENFLPLVNNQSSPHCANRGDSSATIHVEGLNDVKMRDLPPRGKSFAPTFNIPVYQPPMHGVCQPPPIPMARTYVASAHMGGGVGLSGGDHISPHAYPRPMPPQFNGKGIDPMRFMLPGVQQGGHEHDANSLREQVAQLLNEQFGIDNFKTDLIFDHFYKDGQVKLTGGHNIPPLRS